MISDSQAIKAARKLDDKSARMLERATELQDRLLLGQWNTVAECLEQLAQFDTDDAETQKKAERWNHDAIAAGLRELAAFCRTMKQVPGCSTVHFHSSNQAHKAACVLSCKRPDCGEKNNCWETRRWCD